MACRHWKVEIMEAQDATLLVKTSAASEMVLIWVSM